MKRYKQTFVSFRQAAIHMTVACSLSVAGVNAMMPSLAYAQDREFSAEVGAVVNQTLDLANKGATQASLDLLLPLTERTDLSPYERATVFQMIGQYNYELDHIPQTIEAFEKAIASGGLLSKEVENINLNIVQLMIRNKQYQEGVERLETLVRADAAPIELLVKILVEHKAYERALPWAQVWFETANPKERRHYDLLNFLFSQLGRSEMRLDYLAQMIERWPEDTNLMRSLMFELTRVGRDEDAFEVAKLLYLSGGMTQDAELVKLVKNYAFYDMPFQAAEILEREIDVKRVARTTDRMMWLGKLFTQAREDERALPIYETLIEASDDIAFLTTLGHRFSEANACEKAQMVLSKAVTKGYEAGKAQILIGNCYYNQTKKMDHLKCGMTPKQIEAAPISLARDGAMEAFERVAQSSDEYKNAQKWVQFIEAETSAFESQCMINYLSQPDDCYQKIKLAYDAMIFTDGFKLEDESCRQYVEDYDTKFKPSYSEK